MCQCEEMIFVQFNVYTKGVCGQTPLNSPLPPVYKPEIKDDIQPPSMNSFSITLMVMIFYTGLQT